ncbi:MAG: Xylose isomerase-like TIM barrel [Lentisphaerae bacterium ADurb.BinA184]|nr:MAG: Xylose isomerase-like TIM barrel [Lentisphaerae bacterium ADurb.BinA184]
MRISIASYAFHGLVKAGMMDVFGYLETCKHRYHIDAADIWNGIIGPDPAVYLTPEFLKKVKTALLEREMTLANYHADGCHIWEDDPDTRERHHELAVAHLQAAAYLGAETVRIDAGGKGTVWTDEQFDEIVRRYQEYCAFGRDAGFTVGPESHWGPELVPDNMERLAEAVNDPGFGILMHIGHWEGVPEEEGDRRLARYAVHTHVDARITRTRLESAMKLLLDAGYLGHWGVEHHSAKNEYAEVEYQLAEVRHTLIKLQNP